MFDAVVAADTVVINKSNQLLSSRSSQESTCNDRSCHKAGGDFLQGVRLPRFMPKEGERPCKDCCLFCARLASIPIRIAQLGQGFGGGGGVLPQHPHGGIWTPRPGEKGGQHTLSPLLNRRKWGAGDAFTQIHHHGQGGRGLAGSDRLWIFPHSVVYFPGISTR